MVYFVSGVGIFFFFSTCPNCHEGPPILLWVAGSRCFIRDEAAKEQKLITLSCSMKLYHHSFVSHHGALLD